MSELTLYAAARSLAQGLRQKTTVLYVSECWAQTKADRARLDALDHC